MDKFVQTDTSYHKLACIFVTLKCQQGFPFVTVGIQRHSVQRHFRLVSTMAAQLCKQLLFNLKMSLLSNFLLRMIFFLASCTNNIFSVVYTVTKCFHFNKRNSVSTGYMQSCCQASMKYYLLRQKC